MDRNSAFGILNKQNTPPSQRWLYYVMHMADYKQSKKSHDKSILFQRKGTQNDRFILHLLWQSTWYCEYIMWSKFSGSELHFIFHVPFDNRPVFKHRSIPFSEIILCDSVILFLTLFFTCICRPFSYRKGKAVLIMSFFLLTDLNFVKFRWTTSKYKKIYKASLYDRLITTADIKCNPVKTTCSCMWCTSHTDSKIFIKILGNWIW